MLKAITYTYDERGFGVLSINRPEKRNAISVEMAHELNKLLTQIHDEAIKFLVLKSAEGPVFCAGGDLNDLNAELNEEEAYKDLAPMKEALYKLATLNVPTIALLHGSALGGGSELATACDFRIAKETAKFGFVQTNLGILPGWGGGALLYKKLSAQFAYYWITNGMIYSAQRLKNKGWINKVVSEADWNEEALLETYINRSFEQMKGLKAQYLESLESEKLFELMDLESRRCAQLWESDAHKKAVSDFLNKK